MARNLVASAAVKRELVVTWAAAQRVSAADVAGTAPGSVYYGIAPTGDYWAVAGFMPSAHARSGDVAVQVAFQDGPWVFTRPPAGKWRLVTDSGGVLCPAEVPAALAAVWGLDSSPQCHPPSTTASSMAATSPCPPSDGFFASVLGSTAHGAIVQVTARPAVRYCGGPDDLHYAAGPGTEILDLTQDATVTVVEMGSAGVTSRRIDPRTLAGWLDDYPGQHIFRVIGPPQAVTSLAEQYHP